MGVLKFFFILMGVLKVLFFVIFMVSFNVSVILVLSSIVFTVKQHRIAYENSVCFIN